MAAFGGEWGGPFVDGGSYVFWEENREAVEEWAGVVDKRVQRSKYGGVFRRGGDKDYEEGVVQRIYELMEEMQNGYIMVCDSVTRARGNNVVDKWFRKRVMEIWRSSLQKNDAFRKVRVSADGLVRLRGRKVMDWEGEGGKWALFKEKDLAKLVEKFEERTVRRKGLRSRREVKLGR
ncbi:hypothetical protein BJ508DRAFT_418303 [Ascobolus immersus RN42]|uniref:Uncharacterized protein n=1 Tax=Ascobolus immersus RN42 TaxID=1160509 RepID=A0A3N4HMU0_ASCIM|nr:hypothetical protein BJ508DRAFT_418303 [Ascobolus immersus RN42]